MNDLAADTDYDPDEERLALLLTEISEAVQRGEPLEIEDYCQREPKLASDLRALWGTILATNAAAISFSPGEENNDITLDNSDSLDASFQLPYQFGDYQLLEEIGRGGMGVVYRAKQTSLGREVAVKMILRGALASKDDHERFRAEAEAAARLDHPGIAPVYEVGEIDSRPYFSMKIIHGRTLSQLLAAGPLDPRRSARILAEVARAIDFAHQHGILHRDLKPSNILLDAEGRPHVTDFGLAKQTTNPVTLTKSGAILGTPAYMSPEQAAGTRGHMGPSSDVYSLGVILYHMLTGRPPFQASSPVEVVLMVLEQDPPLPRSINPKADRDLEMIALRCLQKPTNLRYDSAKGLASDLEAYLNDEPISARSGRFAQVLAQLFRETHHAAILENWGLLWMWHSMALLVICFFTNTLHWLGFEERWYYFGLWTVGLGAWATVFWTLRQRVGPVTFVERQIAHVWAASMIAIALLFPLEYLLKLPVLELSPILGLINGMVFLVKAGILSGSFYIQAAALFLTSFAMALVPDFAHLIFGIVAAGCFFFPGWKYHKQRLALDSSV